MTTNTLAGPEAQAFWDSSTNQELHNKWTKTWGPDKGTWTLWNHARSVLTTAGFTSLVIAVLKS